MFPAFCIARHEDAWALLVVSIFLRRRLVDVHSKSRAWIKYLTMWPFQRAPDCALSLRRRQLLEHIFCAGGQCLRIGSRAQKMPRPYVLFEEVPSFARRVCITLAIFFHLCMFPTRKSSDSTCSSNSLALVRFRTKCLQVSHPHHRSSWWSFRFCVHLA